VLLRRHGDLLHDGAPLNRASLLALAGFAGLAAVLSPGVARAEGPTKIGVQVGVSGGASLATSDALLNRELLRSGWQQVPLGRPEFGLHFGLTFFDATIDLHFGGDGVSRRGPRGEDDALSLDRRVLGVDLGYRLRLTRLLTLSPFFGFGTLQSTLCLAGRPDATSSPARPPFEQVLRNPGRSTCLDTSDVGMDIGAFLAIDVTLFGKREHTDELKGHLAVGPKVAFDTPLTLSTTWEQTGSDSIATLPAFEGPLAPVGAFFVGLEAQFHFGLE
jgi:hypothetical protein